jgi:hypothetical protein
LADVTRARNHQHAEAEDSDCYSQEQEGGRRQEEEGYVACPSFVPPLLTRPDPNAPKRGLSAYMFFANEQRENVREENPGIAFGRLITLSIKHHR